MSYIITLQNIRASELMETFVTLQVTPGSAERLVQEEYLGKKREME